MINSRCVAKIVTNNKKHYSIRKIKYIARKNGVAECMVTVTNANYSVRFVAIYAFAYQYYI